MLCLKPCLKILINTVSKMISADLMNAGSRKCYLKPTRKYKIKLVRSESTPPVVKKQNGNKKYTMCCKRNLLEKKSSIKWKMFCYMIKRTSGYAVSDHISICFMLVLLMFLKGIDSRSLNSFMLLFPKLVQWYFIMEHNLVIN